MLYGTMVAITDKDKDGKAYYTEIGKVFKADDGRKSYKLETLPINKDWDGRFWVREIERKSDTHEFNKKVHDVAPDPYDDSPIDLSTVPF